MMIGLVTGGEKCGCYVRTLRMLCTEKATVWSAPDGSDKHTSLLIMQTAACVSCPIACVRVCVGGGGHSSMHPKNIFSLLELTLLHFLPSKIGQNWIFSHRPCLCLCLCVRLFVYLCHIAVAA